MHWSVVLKVVNYSRICGICEISSQNLNLYVGVIMFSVLREPEIPWRVEYEELEQMRKN